MYRTVIFSSVPLSVSFFFLLSRPRRFSPLFFSFSKSCETNEWRERWTRGTGSVTLQSLTSKVEGSFFRQRLKQREIGKVTMANTCVSGPASRFSNCWLIRNNHAGTTKYEWVVRSFTDRCWFIVSGESSFHKLFRMIICFSSFLFNF